MSMIHIARCPKDATHKRFITTAHVMQDWVVDPRGYFLEERETLLTDHGPDPRNNWTCAECGTQAVLEAHDEYDVLRDKLAEALWIGCPFCEEASLDLTQNSQGNWHVKCCCCGALGPEEDRMQDALYKWNVRANPHIPPDATPRNADIRIMTP